MPDTPALQNAFGQPGGQHAGCGFPAAHLMGMFDAATGLLLDVLAAPFRTHDLSQMPALHPRLQAGDVLVADRGFCSYAHVALLYLRNIHPVFRLHQKVLVDFTPNRPYQPVEKVNSACERSSVVLAAYEILDESTDSPAFSSLPDQPIPRSRRRSTSSTGCYARPGDKHASGLPRSRWVRLLGVQDQVVEWFKPVPRSRWMPPGAFALLPASMQVRQLRYRVSAPGFRTREITLATTLLDGEAYPADELAELYHCRRQVETDLRYLKTAMGMNVLRCKSVDAVEKELLMFALAYNLVCCVMLAAGRRQGVPPDRISFIDAVRWVRAARDGRPLSPLNVNPLRPGRLEPRVRKRRPKQSPVMRTPRQNLREALEAQRVDA